MNNKLSVITYHYVRDAKKSSFPGLKAQSIKIFKKQLNYFKNNYHILSPKNFLDVINGKTRLKKNSCLLTFDDGYIEHFETVLPELIKRNIYAIFFAPAEAISKRRVADVNKIQLILSVIKDKKKILTEIECYIKEKNFKFNLKSLEKKFIKKFNKRHDNKITKKIKFFLQVGLPLNVRRKICKYLFLKYVSKNETNISKKIYMTLNHLKILKQNGMYIGGHGYHHLRMNLLDQYKQEQEIKKTVRFLKIFNKDKDKDDLIMCYPHGAYNLTTIKLLKKYNFKCAFTSNKGYSDIEKSNLFKLNRLDTNDVKIRN
jgi:peptidoglycan/xylan/chitin deacetylase (PgdA/CDA1 family)